VAVEKVSAGPAMQRPQPTKRAIRSGDISAASEDQTPVGSAPHFDRGAETLITPKAGMLANPVVQQFTSAAREEHTVEGAKVENVDAGAITIKENKKPAKKSPPQKKSQKRGKKEG
jgi:hypothetical protein